MSAIKPYVDVRVEFHAAPDGDSTLDLTVSAHDYEFLLMLETLLEQEPGDVWMKVRRRG